MIFLYFKFNSKIYNYADDNTLSYIDSNIVLLKEKLIEDCITARKWFDINSMKANPDKFQLMFLNHNNGGSEYIEIDNFEIKNSPSINILGLGLDSNLKFTSHVDEICCQSEKQINAFKRIKNNLDKTSKMTIYNSYIKSNFNHCSVVWTLNK